jgi:hypothetical protein
MTLASNFPADEQCTQQVSHEMAEMAELPRLESRVNFYCVYPS